MLACKLKGCPFDSWSGHVPGLQAESSIGGVREATNQCISHPMDVSILVFLPLKMNKILKKIKSMCTFTVPTLSFPSMISYK